MAYSGGSELCPRRRRQAKYDTSCDGLAWARSLVKQPRWRWSELSDYAPEWRISPRPDLLGCVGRMHRLEDVCPQIRELTHCNPLNLAGSVSGGAAYPPLPRQYTSERIPYDLHGVIPMPLAVWPGCKPCCQLGRPRWCDLDCWPGKPCCELGSLGCTMCCVDRPVSARCCAPPPQPICFKRPMICSEDGLNRDRC